MLVESMAALGILALLVLTVIAFWPMNAQLDWFSIGSPRSTLSANEAVAMTHRWIALDWLRVIASIPGLLASIRAISIPYPAQRARRDLVGIKVLTGLFFAGAAAFVVYFVSNA